MTDKELIISLTKDNVVLRAKIQELESKLGLNQKRRNPETNKKRKEKKLKKLKEKVQLNWENRYNHPLWRQRRQQILRRDNYKCSKCANTQQLHVHHLIYQYGFEVWEYEDQYLITLCSTCHEGEHQDKPIESFYNKGLTLKRFIL